MLDGGLMDKLDDLARKINRIRCSSACFGGIQLILSGDFFQLPPVGLIKDKLSFLFEARCWNRRRRRIPSF